MAPRSGKRPSTSTGSGTLRGSRSAIGRQPERQLEVAAAPTPRRPRRGAASRAGRARSPRSLPATRDRSRAPAARDTRRRRARSTPSSTPSARGQRRRRQRQPRPLGQRAHRHGLHAVDDAAPRQRIEPLQRLGLLGGPQPVDGAEQELVRAGREPLQRRHRVRAAAPAAGAASASRVRSVTRTRPSYCVHFGAAARPALGDRCAAARRSAAAGTARGRGRVSPGARVEQPPQHREVVLLAVDRLGGIAAAPATPAWRRPAAAAAVASSS